MEVTGRLHPLLRYSIQMSPVSTWHCFLFPNVCSGHGARGGGGGEEGWGTPVFVPCCLSAERDFFFFQQTLAGTDSRWHRCKSRHFTLHSGTWTFSHTLSCMVSILLSTGLENKADCNYSSSSLGLIGPKVDCRVEQASQVGVGRIQLR